MVKFSFLFLLSIVPLFIYSNSDCKSKTTNERFIQFNAELLIMEVTNDSSSFAWKTSNPAVPQTTGTRNLESIAPNTIYQPGVRLDLLVPLSQKKDTWLIDLGWTFIENNSDKKTVFDDSYGIYTSLNQVANGLAGNSYSKKAEGTFDFKMQNINASLKKEIRIKESLILKPMLGITSVFMDQELDVTYNDILITSPTANSPRTIISKNHSWGVGPIIGLDILLKVFKYLDINIESNFSSMKGKIKSKTEYSKMLLLPPSTKLILKSDNVRVLSNYQIKGDLSTYFQCGPARIHFSLGWETLVWLNQLGLDFFSNIESFKTSSSITLQGPVVKLGIDF